MKVTLQQTEKILSGNHRFSRFSFSMMITRLKLLYSRNPSSLKNCMDEINAFLDKFENIMNKDCAIIEKL